MNKKTLRIESIDVFRALIMFLMVFVNDFWTIDGIPKWMLHSHVFEDYMGLSDIVFPSFLFIVGMSIPLAIKNRIKKGKTTFQNLGHIIMRSFALLAMGIFTVNYECYNADAAVLARPVFAILMVMAFFMIWNVYPKFEDWKKYIFNALQLVGIVLLVYLAYVYRGTGKGGEAFSYFQPRWWGILGLIGWVYLGTALIYLFAQKHVLWMIIAMGLFTILNMLASPGTIANPEVSYVPSLSGLVNNNGSFYGLTFMGVFVALLAEKFYYHYKKLFLYLLGLGAIMFVCALISHNFWIVSKNLATPTWIFICSGIACIGYGIIFWLVEVLGKGKLFNIIKPAGTATLTCYLVPYLFYNIAILLCIDFLPQSLKTGGLGVLKCAIFSLAVVGITWALGKVKIKLKI